LPQNVILGVDIGTSACKAVAVDAEGNILASSHTLYNFLTPRLGWFEIDPNVFINALITVFHDILRYIPSNAIEGISIDGISNSPILVDRDLKVLRPCILWLDQRGAEYISEILRTLDAEGVTPTLPLSSLITLIKLLWVKENETVVWRDASYILQPKDYVRTWLTGCVATDPSDASVTMMFDGERFRWADYVERLFGIDLKKLPEIVPSHEIAGYINRWAAEKTGLLEGTPVITGCADGVADALAAGLIEEYDSLIRLGTAGVFSTLLDKYVPDKERYYIFVHAMPGKWVIQRMFPFGVPHRWFFENLYSEELEHARSLGIDPYMYVEDNLPNVIGELGDLKFIPNISFCEEPSHFSGAFIGIKNVHTKAHLALALLQGLACATKEALDVICGRLAFTVNKVKLIGGGAKSKFMRKMIATLLNTKIEVLKHHDASIGAAILAGIGVGVYRSFREAFDKIVRIDYTMEPDRSLQDELFRAYERYIEVRRRLMV